MPAIVALPAFWAAVGTTAAAGGALAAAKIGSNAYTKGAAQQTAATNYAADSQAKSNADTLAFQREQSARDLMMAESTQRANYDQWAAREGRLSSLGELIGAGPRNIPSYVPIGQSGGATSPVGAAGADLSGAKAAFDKLFPGDTLTPDMLKQGEGALKAAGFTLRPNAAGVVGKVQYGNGPIIDVIQGAASGQNKKWWSVGGAAAPARAPYVSSASSLLSMPYSPALSSAGSPYTAASLMGRG